jgi:hypothetical protein
MNERKKRKDKHGMEEAGRVGEAFKEETDAGLTRLSARRVSFCFDLAVTARMLRYVERSRLHTTQPLSPARTVLFCGLLYSSVSSPYTCRGKMRATTRPAMLISSSPVSTTKNLSPSPPGHHNGTVIPHCRVREASIASSPQTQRERAFATCMTHTRARTHTCMHAAHHK